MPRQPTPPHYIWGRKQEQRSKRFQTRASVVRHLIDRWTEPEMRAADVSGGAGRWLNTLAPKFEQFNHLDLSPDALEVARADHRELTNVNFGILDLVRNDASSLPNSSFLPAGQWEVVFCLDTLLYAGDFVETVLTNLHSWLSPGAIVILEIPTRLRAQVSRSIKRARYDGPERTFSPWEIRSLVNEHGYECLDVAYQFNELGRRVHQTLIARGLTGYVPWPSTWTYLVLRPIHGSASQNQSVSQLLTNAR
ncbi:class I SAM-dependent methyltransferase [Microvirga arabica]|uniref:Class I SAM-dependent methyltransferase n=1 Tax=Microvirga arabica TaxID=1128671 RepID=A0ABV6YDP9_9HYPH